MKIAIHHRPDSYSEQWIEYCKKHNVQYKIVDAYANDILKQIADCDVFMWHFHHNIYKDHLFAKQLIYVIQKQMGKVCYPDFDTCWHFDDKVGQKYLFDALGIYTVPTYIFYKRSDALDWIKHTTFPKVFKLRCGAGSKNVMLVESAAKARKLTRKAFCCGFQKNSHFKRVINRWVKFIHGGCTFKWLLKGVFTFYPYKEQFKKEELGYVYYQDFIPNNNYDIRIFIIGNRAVVAKRNNRINDFRASGSHYAIFDPKQIDIKYIKEGFNISKKLKMQSIAFDFLLDTNGNPILTEISYCCGNKDYSLNAGYWTNDLQWHDCSKINFCDWIIEDLIKKATTR